MPALPRANCGNCALSIDASKHDRGIQTGFCTHPLVGRVVRREDHCKYHQPASGQGWDPNASLKASQQVAEERLPNTRLPVVSGIDLATALERSNILRARSAKDKAWGVRPRRIE